jgi:hypothetical protein
VPRRNSARMCCATWGLSQDMGARGVSDRIWMHV